MTNTLRLEHGIRAPGRARRWIVQRCQEWRCDAIADDAALMVTELVTNVFLHARTDCLIHAEFVRSMLTVAVTDGDNEEISAHPPSTTAEDGRGLAIVAALADTWGIQHNDGAKSVWFRLSHTQQPHV
ncbi:MAG TPA: ATP-binding protein [Nocardioidaceae bacterium]|nr:ATP-binding protein [Nocardioidaceae bacterium]